MTVICKAMSDLIETDVDDETIIVSLESGQLFSVKDTARAIWKLVDGQRDCSAIITELTNTYGQANIDGQESDAIEQETRKFLADAKEAGLIA